MIIARKIIMLFFWHISCCYVNCVALKYIISYVNLLFIIEEGKYKKL